MRENRTYGLTRGLSESFGFALPTLPNFAVLFARNSFLMNSVDGGADTKQDQKSCYIIVNSAFEFH